MKRTGAGLTTSAIHNADESHGIAFPGLLSDQRFSILRENAVRSVLATEEERKTYILILPPDSFYLFRADTSFKSIPP